SELGHAPGHALMDVWKGGLLVGTPYPGLVPANLSVRRLQGAESPQHRNEQPVSGTHFSVEPENRSPGAFAVRGAPKRRRGDWRDRQERVSRVSKLAHHLFQQWQTNG